MEAEIFYKQPEYGCYTHLVCEHCEAIEGLEDLPREGGYFLMAPFLISKQCKPLLFYPGQIEELPLPGSCDYHVPFTVIDDGKAAYYRCFNEVHQAIEQGRASKVVLARKCVLHLNEPAKARQLFFKASLMYPHQFVALINAPQCGWWLMATPEVLLRGNANEWSTMALAGTMSAPGEWSSKNREEQQIVTRYIKRALHGLGISPGVSEPHTVQAAHLYHLCTTFNFGLPQTVSWPAVVQALHPTPAVCGMPKQQALQLLTILPHFDRQYYSGFCGPVRLGTSDTGTSLFVSLRCLQGSGNKLTLYAGGGLLKDSTVDSEWLETENKISTMRNVLR